MKMVTVSVAGEYILADGVITANELFTLSYAIACLAGIFYCCYKLWKLKG